MKVAIPRLDDSIAPRFEYSATISIYTIQDGVVVDELDLNLQSSHALDRVRLLRDQSVDTLICGGVQSVVVDILHAHGIETITWVSGNVDELLEQFIQGNLADGSGRNEKASH